MRKSKKDTPFCRSNCASELSAHSSDQRIASNDISQENMSLDQTSDKIQPDQATLAKLTKVKKRGQTAINILSTSHDHAFSSERGSKNGFRRHTAVVITSIIIVTCLTFTVFAVSQGGISEAWLLMTNSVKEILGLPPGESRKDGITIIRGEYSKRYKSIESLLIEEGIDILYPSVLPSGVHIDSITQIHIDSTKYDLVFKFNSDTIYWSVSNYHQNDLSILQYNRTYVLNDMTFYIVEKENGYSYAYMQMGSIEYSMKCTDTNNLLLIISNMKGTLK